MNNPGVDLNSASYRFGYELGYQDGVRQFCDYLFFHAPDGNLHISSIMVLLAKFREDVERVQADK